MADGENFKKNILLEVEAKTDRLKQDAAELNGVLDIMKGKLRDVEIESGRNSKAYVEQASKVRLTAEELRKTNKELDNTTKAIKAESNSIEQNRALVATMTAEHIKLTQAEGKTSDAARLMEANLKIVNDTLKAQTKAYGDHRLEVGNYGLVVDKLNNSNKAAGAGFQNLTNGLMGTVGGFGFLPSAVSNVASTFTGFVQTQQQVIKGFQQHNILLQKAEEASLQLSVAQQAEIVATEKDAVAQELLAAGKISETEATAASTAAKEANITATLAEKTATEAATVAVEAGTTASKLLKIALASTGIGLLIIALGTLVVWFNNTNEGSKKLKVVMAELNAVFQQIFKIIAPIGKAIFDAFSNTSGVQFLTSCLLSLLIPLRTVIEVLTDIAHGNFSQAFKDIGQGVKDAVINQINGFKAGVQLTKDLAGNLIKAGDEISKQSRNFKDVAKDAGAITVERQKLTKAEREWSEQKLVQQGVLEKLKLQLRDQDKTAAERIELAKQAKTVSDGIFKTNLANAEKNMQLVQREQALNSKKDYQAITDAKNRVQEIKNQHEAEIQSIQNRESRLDKSLERQGAKQLSAQQKLAIAQAKGLTEAEAILKQSQTKQMQMVSETYASEILDAEQHYADDLASLKKLLIKKEIAIEEYNKVSAQLLSERNNKIEKITADFNRSEVEKERQANAELKALQIANIDGNEKQELAAQALSTQNKLDGLKRESDAINVKINQINEEKKTAKGEALIALNKDLEIQQNLLAISYDKMEAITEAGEKARLKTLAKYAQERLMYKDERAVKKSAGLSNVINFQPEEDAQAKLIRDRAAYEIELNKGNAEKIKQINEQTQDALTALHKSYVKKRQAFELDVATQVINQASSLLANSISHNAQKRQADLDKQKTNELKNTSLTTTQKAIIEEKYRKKQGQEKVKEFKANQKLQIAMTLINGAAASLKTIADMGWIPAIPFVIATVAETAIAVATIASQKPPAYADGGLHYQSDGKGAMLRGPGTGKSDSMNARLSNGESVINAKSTSMFGPLLSDINQAGGGRAFIGPFAGIFNQPAFASGGVFTNTYLPTADNGLRQNTININANPDLSRISGALNSLPGNMASAMQGVSLTVDVKDVNHQQSILANVEDRLSNL